MTRRTPHKLSIALAAGSEPEIEMEDSVEVYGDDDLDEFGTVIEVCDESPRGQCEYTIYDPDHCKHCGRKN